MDDLAAREAVEAGLSELDAGAGISLEEFEREMDEFMSELRAKRA